MKYFFIILLLILAGGSIYYAFNEPNLKKPQADNQTLCYFMGCNKLLTKDNRVPDYSQGIAYCKECASRYDMRFDPD